MLIRLRPMFSILSTTMLNSKYSYIPDPGKFVIKPQFDYTSDFFDGLVYVFTRER
jgi:hypothetical protein